MLPPAGSELELQWMNVEEASVLTDMEWKILTVQVPMTQENIQHSKEAGIYRRHPKPQLHLEYNLLLVLDLEQ